MKMDGWANLTHDHYIYYCKWRSLHTHTTVQNAILGCNLKNDRMISLCFQGKPFNITVIQVYSSTTNAKEAVGSMKT